MGATGNREYTVFSTKYWTIRIFIIIMFESHSLMYNVFLRITESMAIQRSIREQSYPMVSGASSSMLGPGDNLRTRASAFCQILDIMYFLFSTAVSGVGSSPALATCETRQILLAVCQVVLPGYSRFAPPIDCLASMSEIILKGTLN